METVLFYITVGLVGLIVLVLVIYLILIITALRRAGNNLEELAGGLEKIARDSKPLSEHLDTINGALTKLHAGLDAVDNHLLGIAKVLKL